MTAHPLLLIAGLADDGRLPPRPRPADIGFAAFGAFAVTAILALLSSGTGVPLMLGSLGASCALVFGFPDSPFSQPRNVIIGHAIGSLAGLSCLALCGPAWWSTPLAEAMAIALMMKTRTMHPPGAANPIIVALTVPGWGFMWFPTLSGAAIVVGAAVALNTLRGGKSWPKYWV
jgi:CBS-domain-containing membrane protein